jgi:LCP family protein required for cell wall assembly
MSRNKLLAITLVVVLLAALGFAAPRIVAAYRNSLNAPLVMDIQASPTSVSTPVNTPEGAQQATNPPTAISPTASTQAGNCGQSGVMTILFLARDVGTGDLSGGAEWPYGADVIRFVRIDFSAKTVRVIAIPRDLWVATPHLGAFNLANSRLGLVFYNVELATGGGQTDKTIAATNALAQSLYDNFGVTPDHYIFFEMRYFTDAIDQLGGVDVNVPRNLTYGENSFSAGPQHLDGKTALTYARLMPGNEIDNGWDRLERQNIILAALRAKALEPANIVKLPGLVDLFKNDFVTDLSPELIADLVCMVDKVPQDQLTFLEIEPAMIIGPGPDSSMLPNAQLIKTFLQEQLAP